MVGGVDFELLVVSRLIIPWVLWFSWYNILLILGVGLVCIVEQMLPAPWVSSGSSSMDCSFVELTIGLLCCWLVLSVRGSTSATPPQLEVVTTGIPSGSSVIVTPLLLLFTRWLAGIPRFGLGLGGGG